MRKKRKKHEKSSLSEHRLRQAAATNPKSQNFSPILKLEMANKLTLIALNLE